MDRARPDRFQLPHPRTLCSFAGIHSGDPPDRGSAESHRGAHRRPCDQSDFRSMRQPALSVDHGGRIADLQGSLPSEPCFCARSRALSRRHFHRISHAAPIRSVSTGIQTSAPFVFEHFSIAPRNTSLRERM
jgi:hypothetical protein